VNCVTLLFFGVSAVFHVFFLYALHFNMCIVIAGSPVCDQTVLSKMEESDSVPVGSNHLSGDSLKAVPRSRTSSDNKKPLKSGRHFRL